MSNPLLDTINSSFAITASGLETTMVYKENIDLPCFASFPQWRTEKGRECIDRYYSTHFELAKRFKINYMLETATWRANPKWGAELGFSVEDIVEINKNIVEALKNFKSENETEATKIILCGVIGPQGDGYVPAEKMTEEQAEAYHSVQVSAFADAGVDLVISYTMNYPEEAIGIVRAAKAKNVNVAISFTVETDSKLGCGIEIQNFISTVDERTAGGPLYYQINCAHLSHFRETLISNQSEPWLRRILSLSPNSSRKSHEELNNSTTLDDGNPDEFGSDLKQVKELLPHLRVFGGCCGTDLRHIQKVCESCFSDRLTQ